MPETQTTQKDPVIVVLQLTGGNDYLNTVIPYNNPLYRDNRKAVGIPDNQIMHLDKDYGIPDYMAPMKKFWDEGKLAVMHGVGYLDSPRSHFRSMDIWHTCEADKVGTDTKQELLSQAKEWGQVAWDSDSNAKIADQHTAEMLQLIVATREYQFG